MLATTMAVRSVLIRVRGGGLLTCTEEEHTQTNTHTHTCIFLSPSPFALCACVPTATPLHRAVVSNHLACTKALVRAGADMHVVANGVDTVQLAVSRVQSRISRASAKQNKTKFPNRKAHWAS